MSSTKPTLSDFAAYLSLDRGLAPLTVESYVADCAAVEAWLQERGRALADAAASDLEDYFAARLDGGLSPRSRNRKLSALRLFFAYTCGADQASRNADPTERLRALKEPRRLPKALSRDEVERLLTAPENLRDALILRVLYAGGLRVSELAALRPTDLDLESGLARVQGKGGKTRLVPLDGPTAQALGRYIKAERPRLKGEGPQDDALFLTQRGEAFTRQGLWLIVKRAAKIAGLTPAPSPHVLRHAYATHLLEGGMGLRSLQMLLGHSDISTTEIYSHVSRAHLKEVLEKHHPQGRKTKNS